jgi:DNA-binding LacI/PurR family transcriptional regulator
VKRVTLTDVAKEAGVHHSTVSRALKHHPGIPEKTREKIMRVVHRLKYVPDPLLSALAAYKNAQRPAGFLANLGWLTNFPTEEGWRDNPHFPFYYEGAKKRAAELGYGLDILWLPGIFASGKAPSQVLRNRSIRAFLLPPQPALNATLDLDWDEFSAVSFGFTLTHPSLHNVALDHFRSIQKLMRKLHGMGYRRPRLILSLKSDQRVSSAWSAGFAASLRKLELIPSDPVFMTSPDFQEFLAAIKKSKPDVVITTRGWATQARQQLPATGLRVPEEIGLAAVNFAASDKGQGGIHEDGALLGRHAVEMLTGMLQRGEKGIPHHVKHVITEGEFQAGETLKKIPVDRSSGSTVPAKHLL